MQSIRAMTLSALVIILAAASCLVLVDCAGNNDKTTAIGDYIDDSQLDLTYDNPKNVLAYMIKNTLTDSEPYEMLDTFAQISESAQDSWERYFYSNLVRIGKRKDEEECPLGVLRTAQAIRRVAKESDEPTALDYLAYLIKLGKEKFSDCAEKSGEKFDHVKGKFEARVETGLDEFITTFAVNVPKGVRKLEDDESLLEVAKTIDLTSASYKVSQALEVAREYVWGRRREKEPEKIIEIFIKQHCDSLQTTFRSAFGYYNFAQVLGAEVHANVPVKFLKLNEYSRVCLTWTKNSDKAEANLLSNIKADKWYQIKHALGQE